GSFDNGGKPRARRPPGIFSISPRAFAAFIRSSHRSRPTFAAAMLLGWFEVPLGRPPEPPCNRHRGLPDIAERWHMPPLRVVAPQRLVEFMSEVQDSCPIGNLRGFPKTRFRCRGCGAKRRAVNFDQVARAGQHEETITQAPPAAPSPP